MLPTFNIVAEIIAQTCDVPRERITPASNLLNDLGIDSLDLLDVAFAIDDAFGIAMPIEAAGGARGTNFHRSLLRHEGILLKY